MIKISSLNKYYYKNKSNEIHVINDFSLELGEKGMVAFFGKSGCGKTTLLNAIGGLDKTDSGSIQIDGKNVSYKNDDIRNEYIGYIFQNYNLNESVTVLENVSDALRLCGLTDEEEIRKRSIIALTNVGMEKYIKRTPNNLSGGQMQRIAIARAIVKNPKIILADEPTGNLDEANTVMIMELLREIANTHLVILVTHEANLVDYYCDKVIELDDGKIVNIKDNTINTNHKTQSKNDIYLGDLDKASVSNEYVNIDYYGKELTNKVNLKIVNNNGKIYLQVLNQNINVLDNNSEVKLIEGKFEKQEEEEKVRNKMLELPPIENGSYGKLFNLKSSIRSGYNQNFRRKKKGKALLKICLVMFTAVLVIITSIFGVSFKRLFQINNSYSHNTFYVYSNNSTYYEKVTNDLESGKLSADYGRKTTTNNIKTAYFTSGYFETFDSSSSSISSCYVLVSSKLLEGKKLLYGKINNLADDEIVISSKVADNLLAKSNVGYIKERKDLLGLITTSLFNNGYVNDEYKKVKVAGIVEEDDVLIYANDYALAAECPASDVYDIKTLEDVLKKKGYNIELNDNEAIYIYYDIPSYYNNVTLNGVDIKIAKSINYNSLYSYDYTDYYFNYFSQGFYVNRDTYISISESFGNSSNVNHNYDAIEESESYFDYYPIYFYQIHSTNPKATLEYLNKNYSDLKVMGYYEPFYSPNYFKETITSEFQEEIVSKIITMVVLFALLSVCMYFIMRSSLIIRIKQIGIYRAIGVNKRNLVFKFLIESLVLTTLTVGLSFVLLSCYLWINLGISSLISELLYYPVWLALGLLVLLYTVCSVCGILPIVTLLRKTPSEILSKYDI